MPEETTVVADATQSTLRSTPPSPSPPLPSGNGGSPQVIALSIPASAEWVRVVRLVTVGVANRLGFTYDEIEDLKLAVAEACNNAILHARPAGEPENATSMVHVTHVLHFDRLEILVADEGETGAVRLPEPKPRNALGELPAALLPESGLGLLLIRSLMDEVSQVNEAEKHTLRMVKYLSPSR